MLSVIHISIIHIIKSFFVTGTYDHAPPTLALVSFRHDMIEPILHGDESESCLLLHWVMSGSLCIDERRLEYFLDTFHH